MPQQSAADRPTLTSRISSGHKPTASLRFSGGELFCIRCKPQKHPHWAAFVLGTEKVPDPHVLAVPDAAAQISTQKTTKTAAASQTAEKPAAGQTASAGTGTTVRLTAQTTAKTTAEPDAAFVPAEQNGEIIYRIIPTDRDYTDGTENEELNSCHAECGEILTVKMTVENTPAAAAGKFRISCDGAEVLSVQSKRFSKYDWL